MFHKTLDEACAGDQMGILLRGVKKDDVRRGMCVAKPGTVKQYDHFEAQVRTSFRPLELYGLKAMELRSLAVLAS